MENENNNNNENENENYIEEDELNYSGINENDLNDNINNENNDNDSNNDIEINNNNTNTRIQIPNNININNLSHNHINNNNINNINNLTINTTSNNSIPSTSFSIPLNSSSLLSSAFDLFRSKKFLSSLSQLILFLKLSPFSSRGFLLKGRLYLSLREPEKAIFAFKKSLSLSEGNYRENSEAKSGLGEALKQAKKFSESVKIFEEIAKKEPGVRSYFALGNARYAMGDKEKAIRDYDECLKYNPGFARAYYNKGICYSNLGDKNMAIRMYTKTLESAPNFVDAIFQKGYCLFSLKQYQKAMQEMIKVIEIMPNYYAAYFQKGECFLNMKRYEEAIISYTKCIEINQNFVEAFYKRAYCCEHLKDYDVAIHDYIQITRLNKRDFKAYFKLGICYLINKIYEKAVKSFNMSISLNRAHVDSYFFLSLSLSHLPLPQETVTATNLFLSLCASSPWRTTALRIKAESLIRLGRYGEAASALKKVAVEIFDFKGNREWEGSIGWNIEGKNKSMKKGIGNMKEDKVNKEVYLENIKESKDVGEKEDNNNEKIKKDNLRYSREIYVNDIRNYNDSKKILNLRKSLGNLYEDKKKNDISNKNNSNSDISKEIDIYYKLGYCFYKMGNFRHAMFYLDHVIDKMKGKFKEKHENEKNEDKENNITTSKNNLRNSCKGIKSLKIDEYYENYYNLDDEEIKKILIEKEKQENKNTENYKLAISLKEKCLKTLNSQL